MGCGPDVIANWIAWLFPKFITYCLHLSICTRNSVTDLRKISENKQHVQLLNLDQLAMTWLPPWLGLSIYTRSVVDGKKIQRMNKEWGIEWLYLCVGVSFCLLKNSTCQCMHYTQTKLLLSNPIHKKMLEGKSFLFLVVYSLQPS